MLLLDGFVIQVITLLRPLVYIQVTYLTHCFVLFFSGFMTFVDAFAEGHQVQLAFPYFQTLITLFLLFLTYQRRCQSQL